MCWRRRSSSTACRRTDSQQQVDKALEQIRLLHRAVLAVGPCRSRRPRRWPQAPPAVCRAARQPGARLPPRSRLRRRTSCTEVHLPQPEADRLERPADVLPHELGVLRPQHLRALPGRRDARGGRDDAAAWSRRRLVLGGAPVLAGLRAGSSDASSRSSGRCSWGSRRGGAPVGRAPRVLRPATGVVAVAVAAVIVPPGTFGVALENLDSSTAGERARARRRELSASGR